MMKDAVERTSQRALAIVERYEGAINYLYPMLLNMSHKHRVLRDEALRTLLAQLGLFHPPTGTGVPIGNLTSQICANIYGHILDRFVAHTVKQSRFIRYMDDTVIFAYSREYLELLRFRIKWFCQVEMGMNFSHWMIAPITRGLNFLGYRIWHTHNLLQRLEVAG
jgi:hypothetical protein